MKTPVLLITASILLFIVSPTVEAQEVTDIDGNTYKTISYGKQEWMTTNLNVTHFRNGDAIPQASTEEEWVEAESKGAPAWCFYENDSGNGQKYGRLYNWYAVKDPRGLAPEGWHIPENGDWVKLVKNLLGVDVAGTKLKYSAEWKKLKGTDNIGFAGIPAGYRSSGGKFSELGVSARWWTNSVPVEVKPSGQIFSVVLSDNTPEVRYIKTDKGAGLSVRCEKDKL